MMETEVLERLNTQQAWSRASHQQKGKSREGRAQKKRIDLKQDNQNSLYLHIQVSEQKKGIEKKKWDENMERNKKKNWEKSDEV